MKNGAFDTVQGAYRVPYYTSNIYKPVSFVLCVKYLLSVDIQHQFMYVTFVVDVTKISGIAFIIMWNRQAKKIVKRE